MLYVCLVTFLAFHCCYASVEFVCNTGQNTNVVYLCRVTEGYTLEWTVKDQNGICYERTYTSYDKTYNKDYVFGAPDFTTSLLSKSPHFTSNISFRIQRNLTGYSITCTDVHGNKKECKLLAPSQISLTLMEDPMGVVSDIVDIGILWVSDQSDRPSLIAVYLFHNVSGEETEQILPAVDRGSYNISSVPRGEYYQFTIYGENTVGNGTKSSLLKYINGSKAILSTTSSVPASVSPSPNKDIGNSSAIIPGISLGSGILMILLVIGVATLLTMFY